MPSQRRVKPLDSAATPETTEQTTVPVGALIPQAHGGALRNGGTNKGGPGATPDEFRASMAALASRTERLQLLDRIMQDDKHPHFMAALKHVTEHGYGKPKETKDINHTYSREQAATELAGLLEEAESAIPARAD